MQRPHAAFAEPLGNRFAVADIDAEGDGWHAPADSHVLGDCRADHDAVHRLTQILDCIVAGADSSF
jgi:hypothetical protein